MGTLTDPHRSPTHYQGTAPLSVFEEGVELEGVRALRFRATAIILLAFAIAFVSACIKT